MQAGYETYADVAATAPCWWHEDLEERLERQANEAINKYWQAAVDEAYTLQETSWEVAEDLCLEMAINAGEFDEKDKAYLIHEIGWTPSLNQQQLYYYAYHE